MLNQLQLDLQNTCSFLLFHIIDKHVEYFEFSQVVNYCLPHRAMRENELFCMYVTLLPTLQDLIIDWLIVSAYNL